MHHDDCLVSAHGWAGMCADGGNSSNVKDKLVDVVEIYSSERAFAAVRRDRTVVTWGNAKCMTKHMLISAFTHDVFQIE